MSAFALETERLLMRPLDPERTDDVQALATVLGDAQVTRDLWMDLGAERGFTVEEVTKKVRNSFRSWNDNGYCKFGVFIKSPSGEAQDLIGYCGLEVLDMATSRYHGNVEIGYRLAAKSHGHGYATEAATACLHDGFERLELSEIVAVVNTTNQSSINVLEKLGFNKWTQFTYVNEVCANYPLWQCLLVRTDLTRER